MLDSDRVVLLSAYIELQLAKLVVTCLLEGAELEDELLVAF